MESTFGTRVRQFRLSRSLSQQAFADQCGLEQGNITQMERGTDPKQSNSAKIKAAFPDLNPDWLDHGTGPMLRTAGALVPVAANLPPDVQAAYREAIIARAEKQMLETQVSEQAKLIRVLKDELGKWGGNSGQPGNQPTDNSPILGFQQERVRGLAYAG